MPDPSHLPDLEEQRAGLYSELASTGDFRPGSLNEVRHRCGKPNCACADPDHPGHGQQFILTKKVAGKTVAEYFKPGPALDKAQREVANYKHFRRIVQDVVEVNEKICETRTVSALAGDQPPGEAGGKKRSSARSSRRSSQPR